ncbi:hypothetical protein PR002_g15906 [Phytophthora rubi]|uniref:Uncharacterized protein n=1 Tax=Phytophthora rubi TaxID=129364 RepID=A0A6A3KMD1_9STRA|nr:hypothetical protein PR002_g15906 [Phytophthora rubi]
MFLTCCVVTTTLSLGKYTQHPLVSSPMPTIMAFCAHCAKFFLCGSRYTGHGKSNTTISPSGGDLPVSTTFNGDTRPELELVGARRTEPRHPRTSAEAHMRRPYTAPCSWWCGACAWPCHCWTGSAPLCAAWPRALAE